MESVSWASSKRSFKVVGQRFWPSLAAGVFTIITVAAVFWIVQHPFGTNWDEANYLNQAILDRTALTQGPWDLIKGLFRRDVARPPAYRILVLPITALVGAHPTVLRLFSWLALGVTLFLVYLTGQRLVDRGTGGFAVCVLLACPIVIGPNMRFYVDYSLYLAIAGTLYFLFCQWDKPADQPRHWIGLGLFLGLGAMAKPTIAFIVGPMLMVTMALRLLRWIAGPTLPSLFKSYGLACGILAPWWLLNGDDALAKAFRSGGNVRDALGPEGELGTLLKWGYVFVQSVTGPLIGILAGAIALSFCISVVIRRRLALSRSHLLALVVCLAGAVPLAVVAALGVNHNPRLIAPLLLPLGLAISLMASALGWLTRKPTAILATVLIVAQVSVMLAPQPGSDRYQDGDAFAQRHNWGNPTSVMRLEEQWDWTPLYGLAQQHQLQTPKIGYLGSAKTLNPPQLLLPWVRANQTAKVDQLWNFADGPLAWDSLLKRAANRDILVTFAPEPSVTASEIETMENQYNLEFSERVAQTGAFMPVQTLTMGKFSSSAVYVFIKQERS